MGKPYDKERLEGPVLMECRCISYFKDSRNIWHQPGTVCELEETEARDFENRGWLVIVETQSLEPPENRIIKYRRKRNAR